MSGRPSPPVIAKEAKRIVAAAIEDGAVSMLVIYEKADGSVFSMNVPGIECVRVGLLRMAAELKFQPTEGS